MTEETPNWGRWVSVYLKFTGIHVPAPWCAAFVAYKVHQAAGRLGIGAAWPKQAYVQSVVNWARGRGLLGDRPRAGQVFVIHYPSLGRYAHMGFVRAVETRPRTGLWIRTVEGNSNLGGSREGDRVVSRWRRWTTAMKAIEVI